MKELVSCFPKGQIQTVHGRKLADPHPINQVIEVNITGDRHANSMYHLLRCDGKSTTFLWSPSPQPMQVKCGSVCRSVVSDSETPWIAAYQAFLSMEFPRQEYWSGQSFPSPGDLPNPGTEHRSPALQADSLSSDPPGKPITRSNQEKTSDKPKLRNMLESF